MERQSIQMDRGKYTTLKTKAEKKGGLCEALWNLGANSYSAGSYDAAWDALMMACKKNPLHLKTPEEFWCPQMKKAVAFLIDDAFAAKMEELTRMRMEGQFSMSMWRRSYRSSDFGYHVSWALKELCDCIYFNVYQQDAVQMISMAHDWTRGFEPMLALEIRRGNPRAVELIREAMLGENQHVFLTGRIIRAVIISGHEELIEILLKLLVAARLQEGLRQQILENADAGSVETLKKIMKVCLDEDLFRYSSATRAFDTWTGLGYGDAKPAVVKKCAQFAYDCLTREEVRTKFLDSENNLEAYFSLWAAGCAEIRETDQMARRLLDDEKKYRRMLGWLFVTRTDSIGYRMQIAQSYLEERDEETMAWVVNNLAVTQSLMNSASCRRTEFKCTPQPNGNLPANAAVRKVLFEKLRCLADAIGTKNKTFTGNPFAFTSITLHNGPVLGCMMSLAGYDMNQEMIDALASYVPWMDVEQRRAFYCNFLQPEKNKKHREYLREALNDKSIHVKELAVQRLSNIILLDEDMEALAKSLRSKSSSLRKAVVTILQKQDLGRLSGLIGTMLDSGEEYQLQAGIELLMACRDKAAGVDSEETSEKASEKAQRAAEAQAERLKALRERKLSTQTEILLNQLMREDAGEETYSEENGFGLYDPGKVEAECGAEPETEGAVQEQEAASERDGLFSRLFKKNKEAPSEDGLLTEKELNALLPSSKEILAVFERMNQVFVRHADYEYEVEYFDGSRKKVLFGDVGRVAWLQIPAEFGRNGRVKKQFHMIPFHEEFLEALGEYGTDMEKMAAFWYETARYNDRRYSDMENQPWYEKIEKRFPDRTYSTEAYAAWGRRYWEMVDLIELMPEEMDTHGLFTASLRMYQSIVKLVGREHMGKNCVQKKKDSRISYVTNPESYVVNQRLIGGFRMLLHRTAKDPEDFKQWFLYECALEYQSGVRIDYALSMADFFRAYGEGLISADVFYARALMGQGAGAWFRSLTNPARFAEGKQVLASYDWAGDTVNRMVKRIVEVESRRGEMPTPLTEPARSIHRFEGAEYFCSLLAALGKEKFFRGYEYSSDTTKRAVLSRLLKRCYPSKEDTPERLKELLKQTDIKENRLAEAVMYAPQWAAFAEEILNWPGLKSAVWFFHAHINETFSAEKETEVAIYSPITPQQFNDGAFDPDWFFKAYSELGEKRFQVLYKSAKYITTGSNQHRRSQLYSDAVLGRLNEAELKQEIIEKRNQEKLRCYPLIPFGGGGLREQTEEASPAEWKKEALRRYEFIQKFLKESRQFGALRRESEKKACNTALENLAITMGIRDVNRMTWYLESEKLEEIRPLMEPQEQDGVRLWLEIGEAGDAELAIEKNGKRQKTLPKTLAKNERVLELKAVIKELKEQKRRARESLERAMVDGTEFGADELRKLSGNPVLSPLLYALVWNDGAKNGFLKGQGDALCLCSLGDAGDGTFAETAAAPLPFDAKLRVAHPHDLKIAGEWADYMHFLYEQKAVQPFKQVFREYYVLTEEERQEKTVSRRYAGHQVQPQKTVALLKGRGWTVDYEEGLQRVYYKENLIVRMYALADWFSPADIEAPTLEVIRFYDRSSGETVDLEKVPPVLFSEAMRDMDLAVSVAHVGGVDPEASHSTVEMRIAIAKELVKLLKLSNVVFIGSHAKIHGTLASYSVHMGSGVVHGEGIGMIAILPVHSQARGRIFLPFADEDPKTAEIMSKMILFAEDQKIKDPAILRQIRE